MSTVIIDFPEHRANSAKVEGEGSQEVGTLVFASVTVGQQLKIKQFDKVRYWRKLN